MPRIPVLLFVAFASSAGCSPEITVVSSDAVTPFCERYCAAEDACSADDGGSDCRARCADQYEREGDPEVTCGPVVRRRMVCIVEAFESNGCAGLPDPACRAESEAVAACP